MACAAARVGFAGAVRGECFFRPQGRRTGKAVRNRRWVTMGAEPSPFGDEVTTTGDADSVDTTLPGSVPDTSTPPPTEIGVFTTTGRFNASPKSLWRALTEYDGLMYSSPEIGKVRRMWISSRVGKICLRLWSQDVTYLWGSMASDTVVEIDTNKQDGVIRYKTRSSDADAETEFETRGEWRVEKVKGSQFLCDVTLRTELIPLRYPVATAVLERWTEQQTATILKQVTKRAIEIDNARLSSPKFFPGLETDFGNAAEFVGTRWRDEETLQKIARSKGLTPAGYLGLSELPLTVNEVPSRDTIGDGERGVTKNGDTASPVGDAHRDAQSIRNWFVDDDLNLRNVGSREVHFRRFDTPNFYHRRAIGAVRIEAPPDTVFKMLNDFQNLPAFIPHLAFTETVASPWTRRDTRVPGASGGFGVGSGNSGNSGTSHEKRLNTSPEKRQNASHEKRQPTRTRVRHVFVKAKLFHVAEHAVTFDFVSRGDKNELGFSAVTGVELGSDKVTQGKWLVVPVFEEEEGFPGGSNPDDGSTTDGKKYPQYGAANPKKPNPKPVATILKFAVEARSLRNKPGSVARMKNVGFWQTGTTFVSDEQKNGSLSETAVFVEMLEMLGSIRGYAEGRAATSGKTDRGSIPGGDGFFVTPRLVPAGEKNNAEPKTKTATTFDPLGSLRLALVERGYGPPPSATTLTSSRGSSVMPTRAELRKRELYSLEKTIADLGGFEKVAASLGWAETRRKPRGYWCGAFPLNTFRLPDCPPETDISFLQSGPTPPI